MKKILTLLLMCLSLSSSAQLKIIDTETGKYTLICLAGVSLTATSYFVNPEPKTPFFRNETRVVPVVFGLSLTIFGLLPNKRGKFYRKK